MRLKNKVAIITGGARGIGKSISILFAKEGAKLSIISRTKEQLEKTKSEIESLNGEVFVFRGDISERKTVKKFVSETIENLGRIDILINNAGILGPVGPLFENDAGEWIKTIKINLIGTFLMTREVIPYMVKNKRGKILNFSGGGAVSPRPNFTSYGSSKAAVVRITETLSEELKKYNIQVNAIAPGLVKTKMVDEMLKKREKITEKELKLIEEGGVSPRLCASLALFLCSEKSNGLTGRLISAVWDDWKNFEIDGIMESELYTVRRLVPQTVKKEGG